MGSTGEKPFYNKNTLGGKTMNAKKLLAVLLALVLCLGTLAACDSKPAETTAPAAEGTTAPAAETTAPAQETTEAAPLTNAEIYPISSDYTFKIATTNTNAPDADNWNLMVDTIGLNVEWQVFYHRAAAFAVPGRGKSA